MKLRALVFSLLICSVAAVALSSRVARGQENASAATVKPAGIRFDADGMQIDAGSVGKFTLEYPGLLDASQQAVHKLVEKTVSDGSAMLKYEGGLQVQVGLGKDGRVQLKFSAAPPEVKFIEWNLHIPISFNQGGTWKAGSHEGAFPKEKPAEPHLLQDHADTLTISNYEGRSLLLTPPPFTYLQLTDSREWNWAIFHFKAVTPFAADRQEMVFGMATSEGSAKASPLVDALGQAAREDWPGKVKSIEELKADVEAEKSYYANLQPPPIDPYGGLPGSQEKLGLRATGYFHLEKKMDRWLLVDPAGDAFFHLGLCSANPGEDYTVVKGRESAFASIPARDGELATAWQKGSDSVVSFHLANLIRKYGEPYNPNRYAARMIERMRKWGFNSFGAFSSGGEKAREAAKFPYVAHLPLSSWEGLGHLPGIEQVWDPFDPKIPAQIDENFAKALPPHADDPLLIGYFMANEPIYENIQHIVPTLKGSEHPCKRRLVQELETKYKSIEACDAAWGLHGGSFGELSDLLLPVETAAAKSDVQEFVGHFLDETFRLVAEAFRRHDPHHLLLGSRLMPGTINNEQLCRLMGKYFDVVSFNYYTNALDTALLRRLHEWTGDKPMMLSEFYWSATKESGLTGGREVATQQERGLAYRNYVEGSAALGFVVGIEWFTLIDQAVTGRSFQGFDGERANTGVLAVTDRPWKPALAEMMKTNYGIYSVWLGETEPFTWTDPRFQAAK